MKDYPKICSKEEAIDLKREMDNRIKDAIYLFETESGYDVDSITIQHIIPEDNDMAGLRLISSKVSFKVEID